MNRPSPLIAARMHPTTKTATFNCSSFLSMTCKTACTFTSGHSARAGCPDRPGRNRWRPTSRRTVGRRQLRLEGRLLVVPGVAQLLPVGGLSALAIGILERSFVLELVVRSGGRRRL